RFGAVDLHEGVVDAKPAKRGENMFGRAANRAGMIAKNSGKFGRRHRTIIGADLALASLFVDTAENDAGIGIGGVEGERNRQGGMDADAAGRDLIFKGGLPNRFHTLSATLPNSGHQRGSPRFPGKPLFRLSR